MISTNFVTKKATDADFTALQKEGVIKVSKFGVNPSDKYISTVSDSEHEIDDNSRFKYLACYISEKDAITSIKIIKYAKKNHQLIEESSVILPLKQGDSLANFLKFLSDVNLGTLSSGKFVLADNLNLDPELYSKLVTLSGDIKGKDALVRLFDEGYLTAGLDISDLIRRGLSQTKINEKLLAITEFEKMIENPNVKEVADIQNFLKDNPWIFGPEYKDLDFRDAGFSGNPDGRLLRIDGLSDILEVKLPAEELLRADDKGRQFIAPKLAESVGQLTGYLEYYYSEYSHDRDDVTKEEILKDAYGKYYKPKGILLIGRRGKEMINATSQTISAEPKNMRRLLSYYHWVEVLTYDDLIERAKNGLANLTCK
jgi:hypothetical protein